MATAAALGLTLGIGAGDALAAQTDQAGLNTTNRPSHQVIQLNQRRRSNPIKLPHQDKTPTQDNSSEQKNKSGDNFGKKVEPKEEPPKK